MRNYHKNDVIVSVHTTYYAYTHNILCANMPAHTHTNTLYIYTMHMSTTRCIVINTTYYAYTHNILCANMPARTSTTIHMSATKCAVITTSVMQL